MNILLTLTALVFAGLVNAQEMWDRSPCMNKCLLDKRACAWEAKKPSPKCIALKATDCSVTCQGQQVVEDELSVQSLLTGRAAQLNSCSRDCNNAEKFCLKKSTS